MTTSDLFIVIWLLAGTRAMFFALRRHRAALRDDAARRAEGTDGPKLLVTSGRIRSGGLVLVQVLLIVAAAALAAADRLTGSSVFGVWILILLTGIPLVLQQRLSEEDDREDRLLDLLKQTNP